MATQQQKESIEELLSDYAKALSIGDAGKISEFYTADAVFMPEKGLTIKSAQKIKASAEKFFKTQDISISYTTKEIVVEQDFAFVTAQAEVTNGQEKVTTRDFFVIKNVSDSWKIFRYIFNAI